MLLCTLGVILGADSRAATLPQVGMAHGGDAIFPLEVEYSNRFDERAVPGGGGHNGLDPGQVLYTKGFAIRFGGVVPGHPRDATDFFPADESGNEPDHQVDALAAEWDWLFDELRDDLEDAHLLVSVDGDPLVGGERIAIFRERSDGSAAALMRQTDLNPANPPGGLEELDGMELWGPLSTDDAIYFSLAGDASGTSVYRFAGAPIPWIDRSTIHAAITTLGFGGSTGEVDVDALMVKDKGVPGVWEPDDAILFSIRAAANFDGGEIIHLRNGASPNFLVHGGHPWNTAFSVADALGVETEEVDAIEGLEFECVPLPVWASLLLATLLAVAGVTRLRISERASGRVGAPRLR